MATEDSVVCCLYGGEGEIVVFFERFRNNSSAPKRKLARKLTRPARRSVLGE